MNTLVTMGAFGLVASVASTWYWWLRVRHLEKQLTDAGYIVTEEGIFTPMNTEEQKIYSARLEADATECGEQLAGQIDWTNQPIIPKAVRAAIKLAYIRGAQWAMNDALNTIAQR